MAALMPRRATAAALIALLLGALAPAAATAARAGPEGLPNVDLRAARSAPVPAARQAARRELERELGARVHLDLSVRVRRSWRADEALLDRLGIT